MALTDNEITSRIAYLTRDLNHHNELYYNKAAPVISDGDYDRLLEELNVLEQQHPELALPDSPTHRVGGRINKNFNSVTHAVPMLSLTNTYDETTLREFDTRVRKVTGDDVTYVCELKWDGVAISLHYQDGVLIRAVTRGDGVQGDDITDNVRTIRSIPLRLKEYVPGFVEVRGEVLMPHTSFAAMNEDVRIANEEIAAHNLCAKAEIELAEKEGRKSKLRTRTEDTFFANARNATAGTLKLQNSGIVSKRKLHCYVYYLESSALANKTLGNSLDCLTKLGFDVSPKWERATGIDTVWEFILSWEAKRDTLSFNTDGVVVKVDSYKLQQDLGATAKAPRWAVAYKYAAEVAETTVLSIDFSVGRTGAVTPVANLSPVPLAGTTVKRASLYNADEIDRLDLHLGDMVRVEKSGEIIPKIVGVLVHNRKPGIERIQFPHLCPNEDCKTPLIRDGNEAAHYCPNSQGCPPQIIGRLEHFVMRDALYIDGFGEKILARLYKLKRPNGTPLVATPADLYDLTVDTILELGEGFKEKSAKNLMAAIEDSKKRPFQNVLFGLGIRFVGETVAEKLAQHFGSLDALMSASLEELEQVPEIGTRIAHSVKAYFEDAKNKVLVLRLKNAGLQITYVHRKREQQSNRLEGKSFLISGTFDALSREQLAEGIEKNGGKIASGVSAKLDYLIAGQKAGASKLDKAKKLIVPVIDEAQILEMLGL